jgi:thiol-disulfide isomerase/thioredoxin
MIGRAGTLRATCALIAVLLPAAATGQVVVPRAESARAAGMEAYPIPLRAPAFRLPGLDGGLRGKDDYRGKVVLLNFWASWCAPCRQEFPSLERLQHALGGGDFTVLAVAVADSESEVRRFLGGAVPPFDVLLDGDQNVARGYRAAGVPVTYLLDRDGRMLAGKSGPHDWDSPEVRGLIRHVVGIR